MKPRYDDKNLSRVVMLLCFGGTALLQGICISAADEKTEATWPVETGSAREVVLSRFMGVGDMLLSFVNPSEYEEITVHQYDRIIIGSVSNTARRVHATGNSVTFRVEEVALSSNIVNGSGDRKELPVRLLWDGDEITAARPKAGHGIPCCTHRYRAPA